MSLHDMTTEAMLGVSEHLLNPPADRPQLHDQPELISGMLILGRAHHELLRVNQVDGMTREKLEEIKAKLLELDTEHDRASRGIYLALKSAANLTDDPVKSIAYKKLGKLLHPTGLSTNQISYLETAGNVLRVSQRITPEARELLKTIVIDNQTTDVYLDRWLDAGREIGNLQTQREMLNTDEDPNHVSPAIIQEARSTWIRAVEIFRYSLHAAPYTADQKSAILAALDAAITRAARSRKKAAEAKDEKDKKDKQKAEAKALKNKEKADAKEAKAQQKAQKKPASQLLPPPQPEPSYDLIPANSSDPNLPPSTDYTTH